MNSFAPSQLGVDSMEQGLYAETKLTKLADTQYAKEFENRSYHSGESITVYLPPRVGNMTAGPLFTAEDTIREPFTITVSMWNIGPHISSAELKLEAPEFVKQVTKPYSQRIARFVEQTGFDTLKNQGSMQNGSPGVAPANFRIWAETFAKMRQMLIPSDNNCYAALDALTMAGFADSERKIFNPRDAIGDIWKKGEIQEAAGIGSFFVSQNLASHTNGDGNVTGAQVNATPLSGTSVVAKGTTGTIYTKGSQFYFSNSMAVDPETKTALTWPMVFTLTADAYISSTTTLVFDPPLATSGSLQNVSVAPTTNDYITFIGAANKTYKQNLMFDKDAICLVGLPLPDHDNASGNVSLSTFKNVPLRCVDFTDWNTAQRKLRFDIMFGWARKRYMHIFRLWDLAT